MKAALLVLALLLFGCAPTVKPPPDQVTQAPVQNPTSTQVTVVAQSQLPPTDVLPLAESIRFSGIALVLATLIAVFGRSVTRAFQRTRRRRGPDAP